MLSMSLVYKINDKMFCI